MTRSAVDSDPGLQPARTQLAWRRTALSIAVGSVVAARLLPQAMGALGWMVPGILGVIVAGWLWWIGGRRQKFVARESGTAPGRERVAGASALLALSAFATVVGLTGVAVLIMYPRA